MADAITLGIEREVEVLELCNPAAMLSETELTKEDVAIHCYKPDMKEKMREVMRYAGPRMMWYHPIAAIKHLIREL